MPDTLKSSKERRPARSLSRAWGWPLGLAVTFAFYAVIPYAPFFQAELQRYFCAHWIEYATTGLFFIGLATLFVKACHLPAERRALAGGLLDGLDVNATGSPLHTVERITTHVHLVARQQMDTHLVRRVLDVCDYVRSRRSIEGLESQLSYLADLAATRLHSSYALVRTVTWAVPILGFLGTVIGITMSIANITPDQLESSLGDVTAGLAVAFDTTALSLTLSMILVFNTFMVDRQEQQILDEVEDFSMQKLVALFPAAETMAEHPLLVAEQQAADQLLQKTESLVSWQMEAWKDSLDGLRDRWAATLDQQQQSLDMALQSGLTAALTDHAQQLSAARHDFVSAFGQAAESMRDQLTVTQNALHQHHVENLTQMQDVWQGVRQDLLAVSAEQAEQWDRTRLQSHEDLTAWQSALQEATQAMTSQLLELRQQGETLLKLTEQEEQLVRLEERLAQNIETVRMVDALDETLLNLNAAVNLLSARTRNKAA